MKDEAELVKERTNGNKIERVGQNPQSLNCFAESVSEAEALCAKIASILKGLQGVMVSLAAT
jgi:ABC-type uncharacterized transport system permease subunit